MSKPVWLITGCSSGFGEALARYALQRNLTVVATSRGDAEKRLSSLADAGADVLPLDVTDPRPRLDLTIAEVIKRHSRLDVLVNNSGMVMQGTIEETSDEETRFQMEVNFFGLLNLTRAVLPQMRKQKSGTIVNIGSRAGRMGIATSGLYCATKFALEAITETLNAELVDYNIRAMCVEPGNFLTDVFAASNTRKAKSRLPGVYRDDLGPNFERDVHHQQRGDAAKGAKVIIDCVLNENKPMPQWLALGPDAVEWIRETIKDQMTTLETWADESNSTDRDNWESH